MSKKFIWETRDGMLVLIGPDGKARPASEVEIELINAVATSKMSEAKWYFYANLLSKAAGDAYVLLIDRCLEKGWQDVFDVLTALYDVLRKNPESATEGLRPPHLGNLKSWPR